MKERLASDDLLADVRVPALVIAGAQDTYISPLTLRETAAALPDAQYVELAETGHLPQFEAPERTARALAEFAARTRA